MFQDAQPNQKVHRCQTYPTSDKKGGHCETTTPKQRGLQKNMSHCLRRLSIADFLLLKKYVVIKLSSNKKPRLQ